MPTARSTVHIINDKREVKPFEAGEEVPDEWAKHADPNVFVQAEDVEPKGAGQGESFSGDPAMIPPPTDPKDVKNVQPPREAGGAPVGDEGPDYEAMKVDDLKDEAERRGLPKSGTKDELVARLIEHDAKV